MKALKKVDSTWTHCGLTLHTGQSRPQDDLNLSSKKSLGHPLIDIKQTPCRKYSP